jgi:hypothetical protein
MYYNTTQTPGAWIVDPNDRGRKKIFLNNKIYLENNKEFLIELFNPLQDAVLAKITINGKNASENGLILRPGERFYLDCFINDKKKFIFKTYEIENTNESLNATSNNGYIEVSFFKEKNSQPYNNIWNSSTSTSYTPSVTITPCSSTITIGTNTGVSGINFGSLTSGNSTFTNCCNDSFRNFSKSIDKTETGRVEKGSNSNQKFESVSMDFESYSLTKVSYQILPESKKPIETKELKKNFCNFCGFKNKDYKFCPNCGEKI